MTKEEKIELSDVELRLVKRSAEARNVKIDGSQRHYTVKELAAIGVVREGYISSELREKGMLADGVVTSFDEVAQRAESELLVDAPFGSGIVKWQLPIELSGVRVMFTRFSPGTVVKPHVHPIFEGHRGGGFRLVLSGSIAFADKQFGPGDWFYIPNDTPYSFVTAADIETHEAYIYEYTPRSHDNRFSSPIAVSVDRTSA